MNQDIKPADLPLAVQEEVAGPDADRLAVVAVPAQKPRRRLVTTLTLSSSTCKWPIGDPAKSDFHYCGLPPQSGRPYCETHDNMSYQPTPRRRAS